MTETEKAVLDQITFIADNLPPDFMRVVCFWGEREFECRPGALPPRVGDSVLIKVEFPVRLKVASVHWDYLRHTVEVDLKERGRDRPWWDWRPRRPATAGGPIGIRRNAERYGPSDRLRDLPF